MNQEQSVSPVEKAAQLGTEHGAQAAEEWLENVPNADLLIAAQSGLGEPQPSIDEADDPDTYPSARLAIDCGVRLGDDDGNFTDDHERLIWDLCNHYEEAFTAAVEATIRANCEEVTS